MKTDLSKAWKRLMLFAWLLTALSALIWGVIAIIKMCAERADYIETCYQIPINDSLRWEEAYPNREYVQIYNSNMRRYISPKMAWFSVSPSPGDSLIAFCDTRERYGLMNLYTGRVVVEPIYERTWNFSEGLAAVCRDRMIGFVDVQGEEVIPCKYPISPTSPDNVEYVFYEGYCVINSSCGKCGLINQWGQLVVDTIYDDIAPPSTCNVRVVKNNGKYGLLTLWGEIFIPIKYDGILLSDTQIFVIKDGVMKQLDFAGNVVQPFCSEYIFTPLYLTTDKEEKCPTGYFLYYVNNNVGVINSQGKVVIPALYHQIEQLSEVLFAAEFSWEYDNYKGIWTTIRIDD